MRAAFCPAPGRIEVREVPRPDPAPGEVVVRVRACGICGSDLHWYGGGAPAPRVCPGHEIAGEVAACGAGVAGVRAGDRVAIEPLLTCGTCRYCRAGQRQLCVRLRIAGMHRPGGLAEFVAVPAETLFAVPDALDWPQAALAEPTAVAVHAVRLAAVSAGQRVLVLGAGSIGLLALIAARAAGAAEVWITARHPHQAALASRFGAARVFAADADGSAALGAASGEADIDVVLETVGGTAATLTDAVRCVRPGGTVVVLGVFTAAPTLPATLLLVKEVRLVGAMTYDRTEAEPDFACALRLLVEERERLAPLITHRVPLDRAADAFATAADKRAGAVKVCVIPD